MSNTATIVYNHKVGFIFGRFDLVKTEPFEQLSNLPAFILIDLAAEGIYSKSFPSMI